MTTNPNVRTAALAEGRRADSLRRRQRVLTALDDAAKSGGQLSASAIARSAGVDRSFLYRHHDLLEELHALAERPASVTTVSRSSLEADLHAAKERNARYATRVQQLEHRLSQLMGEQTWQESGLGAPDNIDQLRGRIALLEAELADVKIQLVERTDELKAARSANRELFTNLNLRSRSESD
ncbi:DUF6262 family protein [Ferrimicrobium sp.]|uniref:DUF6262 family protein n=1 Tax=Ferrimicrobium sp. TaxID=2926050 RepID=UPI002614F3FA|nr:DUF6262 family protein [Ferrimicrobium sp.]